MHVSTTKPTTLAIKLVIACFLLSSTLAWPQDAPPRFEAGGSFTTLRLGFIEGFSINNSPTIVNRAAVFGPAVEGDFNITRHIALDGAYSWLPTNPQHVMTGLFGAKIGTRTQHFGFFGKVRPGFISLGKAVRQEVIIINPPSLLGSASIRTERLTERALDVGGVFEYYPARHWVMRWDAGDTIAFEEPGAQITSILNGVPSLVLTTPGGTVNNFQFSTGVHYRF